MKNYLMLFGLLCGLGLATGCEEDEPATCSEAMSHMYAMGCTLVVSGNPITQAEAISGCVQDQALVATCGCLSQHEAGRDCMAGIALGACEACNTLLTIYGNCVTTNCS